MSGSGGRSVGGVALSQAIPGISRKVVQSIKEICGNPDDEIYAMLKECNMDPNQAVQRLLNQDPFLEVKRKRDKKKEKSSSKEPADSRSRPVAVGAPRRGGRNGVASERSDRRSSVPVYNANDSGSIRPLQPATAENGTHSAGKSPASAVLSYSQPSPKAISSFVGNSLSHSAAASISAGISNGSPFNVRAVSPSPGAWAVGSNHATMADVLKSNVVPVSLPSTVASQVTVSLVSDTSSYQDFPYPNGPTSLGMYESVNDPVLHPSLDSRMPGTGNSKRDVGTVGNQRPIGGKSSTVLPLDGTYFSPSTSQPLSSSQSSINSTALSVKLEKDVHGAQGSDSSTLTIQHESPVNQRALLDDTSRSFGIQTSQSGVVSPTPASVTAASRTTVVTSQINGRPLYQQQPFSSQKGMGANLEWKPKLTTAGAHGMPEAVESSNKDIVSEPVTVRPPALVSSSEQTGIVSEITSKLKFLNTQDEVPVIMPNHLQVPEADYAQLSFGSFGETFGSALSTSYGPDDTDTDPVSISSTPIASTVEELPLSTVSSVPSLASQNTVYHQATSAAVEHLSSTTEVIPESAPELVVSQSEVSKSVPAARQGTQFSYLQAVPNYSGLGLVPQVPSGLYSYDVSEAHPQDTSRLPSPMQSYTDPATSYYSPAFRPNSDAEGRYAQFLPSNSANKYNGNLALLAAQTLSPLQDTGNSVVLSSTSPVPQTSSGQTIPTVPQQHVPIHAYAQPAGLPLGHFTNVFGYQYVPPSYTYMHSPYQPTYAGNSGYPQAPIGSGFTPTQSNYQPSGAAAVKYPFPQYKPLTAAGTTPQAAGVAGYGGYNTASSVYAANPTVTAATASSYEDVGVPPYKESSVFISGQQVEGSTMWIQAQLSRDMVAAGMQPNSYYNLSGQGQHSAYAHTQSLGHAHTHPAGYASLYHPAQSGAAPSIHQLLQPQTLVGGSGAGTQAAPYQQPQRAQQTWTNPY
ncbi:hypothetical protein O6H91_11G058300 [Diphasiastrum complanatum]|uniref:Uncharacterized protein n=2 Tax=Diphasiastrum complanatum TaxID=34168 RepID=A0ACC2CAJ1_DIPCM|nr:hypothetical protein O6H91_11G058100 [Diphasiastrum complanatum]KAJ7538652.1 hypothetical protein O6H91_11G058300 [Diphasiastrum complanatum]